MNQLRIYICGPITGVPNYRYIFRKAKELLAEAGYKNIVNPAELCEVLPESYPYERILELCFGILTECDVLCLLPNWEKSTGCNREYGFALASDMIILDFEDLIEDATKGGDGNDKYQQMPELRKL